MAGPQLEQAVSHESVSNRGQVAGYEASQRGHEIDGSATPPAQSRPSRTHVTTLPPV